MKIVFHIGLLPHHKRWCTAFQEGLKRHGIESSIVSGDNPKACDLAIFWGHRFQKVINWQRSAGLDYLVLENGYMCERTTKWASAGFNGLNGYADFLNADMPPERWNQHFADQMRPWRSPQGDCIAIMGQVPGDQSLRGKDIYRWAAGIAAELAAFHFPVLFCPHPLAAQTGPEGMDMLADRKEAFRRARTVVTFNSNSAVDAVLAGIPVMVCDKGGMAWPVASHAPGESFRMPDRTQWAHNLAWCQWTEEEFRNGDAWEHLRKKYA